MKNCILWLVLVLTCTVANAQNQDVSNKENKEIIKKKAPKQASETQQKQQPNIWPKPFQPSKEIGADSQISFPTDI